MNIKVYNREFYFHQLIEDKTGELTNDWECLTNDSDHELTFSFDGDLFKDEETGLKNIDWDAISHFVKHVLDNPSSIDQKGQRVLEALHKEVFTSPDYLKDNEGFFLLGDVELQRLSVKKIKDSSSLNNIPEYKTFYYFQYDATFFLDSRKGYLMDPYHQYYATFSNHNGLTMIGVTRFG